MRTTLTIDEDVEFGLRRIQNAEPERSFKEIVNDVLRQGLKAPVTKTRKHKRFVVKPFNLGLREGLSYDNIEELLDIVEGPNRR
ncbi:MAG: DUF2191 domain-containing protein [Acidobacteriota bacterium]|nr:MAG: DUF2191 domain-containing protein [Acidobacteriota bacterium]